MTETPSNTDGNSENDTVTLRDEGTATDEVLALAVEIADGWYPGDRIEWDDVWDRLDGAELADGRVLDIPDLASPAQTKIKNHIRALRKG